MTSTEALKICSKCAREYRAVKDFLNGTSGWSYCTAGNLWFQCGCGQSLMLSKGRFDWFSPSLFLKPAAAEIFKQLAQKQDLPYIPTAVLELQSVVRDEKATPAALATALKKVPVLAVEILKIANNVKAASGQKITSMEHAIVFVGRKSVADITQMAAIRAFTLKTTHFQAAKFWDESLAAGRIAEHLARKVAPHLLPDEAYIATAMCNIGKVVGAICHPEATDKVHQLVTASRQLPSWRAAEKLAGATDHCLLGEIGAVVWGMPAFVKDAAMRHHERPQFRPKNATTVTDVVVLANQMAHWVLMNPNRIDRPLLDAAAVQFGLQEADLQRFADELISALRAA